MSVFDSTQPKLMLVYHDIAKVADTSLCVGLQFDVEDRSLEVLIRPNLNKINTHQLCFQASLQRIPWGWPFNPKVPEHNVAAAIATIIEADGQAYRDLVNGIPIVKKVRGNAPNPHNIPHEFSSVSEYRSLRVSAVDLIRPMLLAEPTYELLRAFQKEGVNWLVGREKAILADDMGLGKTVQAIYALRVLFNRAKIKSALVVAPKSLLANWEEELTRWAPELSRARLIPSSSIRSRAWETVLGACHVLLTNYEQLRDPPAVLTERGVDVVIADEAHRLRNIGSQVAQGVRKLTTSRFWALTGTPFERDPEDLATLLSILEPNKFSISDRRLHPASLRAQARPYVLRRLKVNVLKDLPEVWEQQQVLDLLPGQRESYSKAWRKVANSSRDRVLAAVNELRTICDYDHRTGESVKVDRIVEILQDVASSNEKAVVFSYLLKPLDVLEERLNRHFGKQIGLNLRGDMSSGDRESAITRFKVDPEALVLLCSLRVAGEGLTLTSANHVIFLNEWWNPSANIQARDRVVRIGQRKGVRLYKFRCRNTIEDNLEEILARKSQEMINLIDRLADPGQSSTLVDSVIDDLLRNR